MSETKELTEQELLQDPSFKVTVTDDFKFDIANYDQMLSLINDMNERYKGAGKEIKDLQRARKDLALIRKLPTALDDRRKEIVKPYQASIKKFKSDIDALTNILENETITNLANGISAKEQVRKDVKAERIQSFIAELAFNYPGVDMAQIELDPKWLNAGTKDKDIKEAITEDFQALDAIRKQRESDVLTITTIAEKDGGDESGWIALLDAGYDVPSIIKRMQAASENKREEMETRKTHKDVVIDTDTGEVVAHTKMFHIEAPLTPVQVAYIQRYLDSEQVQYSLSRTEDK